MIKSALEFLMNAGKTEIIDVDEQKYATKPLVRINSFSPKEVNIATLTGIVDYITQDVDGICEVEDRIIHVVSEREVALVSPLRDDAGRDTFIRSIAITPRLTLNAYLDLEQFNVMLQSCFLENEDRRKVLALIGNIKEENVKNTSDDGVKQCVTAKMGIATVGYVEVPNPVLLIPFRTFVEVEQPESKFVLRIKEGPQAALFEADGGEWRLSAMLRIKNYLEEKLPMTKILA